MSPSIRVLYRSRADRAILGARKRRALAVALLLGIGLSCSTAPVEQATGQVRQGVLAADQGYWEEAEFRWLKSLAMSGDDARVLNNLAVRFEREGEFQRAKDHYDRALAAANPDERAYIERNVRQFQPLWDRVQSDDPEQEGQAPAAEPADPPADGEATGVTVLEILIAVPDQGPNLAGYDRILVGNFAPTEDSESDINGFAVTYLRRRITQRTFFETQDQLEMPLEPQRRGPQLLADPDYWVQRAAAARADLVLTGYIGLTTRADSTMVRERIRSPDGEVRTVARFQDSVVYKVDFDYALLRGEDGTRLLGGEIEAEQSFPADESLSEDEAVLETLEQLLPQVLDAVTPQRSEQSRYLIY